MELCFSCIYSLEITIHWILIKWPPCFILWWPTCWIPWSTAWGTRTWRLPWGNFWQISDGMLKLYRSLKRWWRQDAIVWHIVWKTFSSVQSLSRVRLLATPWISAHQASLSITNSRSLFKLMSIESVMPSNHLILCCPLLLLPPIPPSIRVFSNESALCMRWPKYLEFQL